MYSMPPIRAAGMVTGSDSTKSRAAALLLSSAVNRRPPAVIVIGVPSLDDAAAPPIVVGVPRFTDASGPVADGEPVGTLAVSEEHAPRATAIAAPAIRTVIFLMPRVDAIPSRLGSPRQEGFCQGLPGCEGRT